MIKVDTSRACTILRRALGAIDHFIATHADQIAQRDATSMAKWHEHAEGAKQAEFERERELRDTVARLAPRAGSWFLNRLTEHEMYELSMAEKALRYFVTRVRLPAPTQLLLSESIDKFRKGYSDRYALTSMHAGEWFDASDDYAITLYAIEMDPAAWLLTHNLFSELTK